MAQSFVKGRTNQHLTWVMVDATDFATPESALSAATKIKVYGKVRGGTGVNFVSSGTGSLTNDITHVGASALGIYTIALAKADLSDASNAWYDQYIISLSATGAAYQTLVVDGGIDASALSAMQSRLSDMQSYLVAMSGMLSDTHSAAILGASHASDAHSAALLGASAASDAHSAALIIQSRLSDLDSRLVSDLSDVRSGITALSDAVSNTLSAVGVGNSRALLLLSNVSDVQSALSDAHSDLASKIGAITATLSASDISDIASAVAVALSDSFSDVKSAVAVGNSRVLLVQSAVSDANSRLLLHTSTLSDIQSALSDAHSDLKSAIGDITVSLDASNISDIASAVVEAIGEGLGSDVASKVVVALSDSFSDVKSAVGVGNSRVLLVQSQASDTYSLLSDLNSNFHSRIPKEPAARSQLSDIGSDLLSYMVGLSGAVSDAHSAATLGASHASDAHSAANIAASRALLVQSRLSDLDSRLASDLSDTLSAAQQANSRLLVNQSRASDIYSLLSDLESNFGSRVPKEVAARSQLSDAASDVTSDLRSFIGATVSSDLSDLASAVAVASSRVTLTQSRASDIYSLLSDLHSDVAAVGGAVSDVYSLLSDVGSDVDVLGSAVSDVRSAVAAVQADLPQKVTRNAALANFMFFMVLSSDHVTGATGKTVTATRSLDGAAFAACANAVTEVSNGWYKIDLAAGDLDADVAALKFSATDCDSRNITVLTQPT